MDLKSGKHDTDLFMYIKGEMKYEPFQNLMLGRFFSKYIYE